MLSIYYECSHSNTLLPNLPSFSLIVIQKFDYVFAENGTVQYKDGKLLSKQVGVTEVREGVEYILAH